MYMIPSFGKELFIRLIVCFLCILSLSNFSYFFLVRVLDLIVPSSGHCLPITFRFIIAHP